MPWACPRRIAPRGSDATSARSFAIVQFDLPSDTWGEAIDAKVERITAGKSALEIYRVATALRVSHFDAALTSSVGRLQINITSSLRAANWFGRRSAPYLCKPPHCALNAAATGPSTVALRGHKPAVRLHIVLARICLEAPVLALEYGRKRRAQAIPESLPTT